MLKVVKDILREPDVNIGQEYYDKMEPLFQEIDDYPANSPKRWLLGAKASLYLAITAKHFFSRYPE